MYSFNWWSIVGKKRWKYRKKKYIYIYKYLAYYFIRFPVRFSRSHQDHPLNNNYEIRKRREISKDFEMTLKIIKKKKKSTLGCDRIALKNRKTKKRSKDHRSKVSRSVQRNESQSSKSLFQKRREHIIIYSKTIYIDLSRTIS